MEVLLQPENKPWCVACATINVLRHFGEDAPLEEVAATLRLPRRPGSYVHKAAKWLARQYGLHVRCSRAPYLIHDPIAAAREAGARYGALLRQGYVGMLHRQETRRVGHAVVLIDVIWLDGESHFVTYDSNKRRQKGWHTYRGADYVTRIDNDEGGRSLLYTHWVSLPPENRSDDDVKPTGRSAWFVRPAMTTGVRCLPG